MDFRKAVEAFAGEYLTVASLEECPAAFSRLKKVRGFTVCEVIIDPECSFAQRQQFRETAELELKKMLP
jgi:thiamine pyrophosphate-dependent acetolactate synthase large subunit-like protein